MNSFVFRLLHLLYPLELPNTQRDRPLEVLALGLSRTGTDSLRQALMELGYHNVYHGFEYSASHNHSIQWIRLAQAQQFNDMAFLTAKQFDRILGRYSAVTDVPAAPFAKELIALYPEAKIIVNYREDVESWQASCIDTIEKASVSGQSWSDYILTYFESSLFWRQRSFWWVWSRHSNGDFERNGKAWYRRHYQELEESLAGKEYLRWKVQDGWEPLCDFLGKPVPSRPFPQGNVPKEFMKRALAVEVERTTRAKSNLLRAGIVLASSVVCLVALAAGWRLGAS